MKTNKLFLFIALYGAFLGQFYSYSLSSYTPINENTIAYQQLPITNSISVGINLIVLVCVIALFFLELYSKPIQSSPKYLLITFVLITGVCLGFVRTVIDIGFIQTLYSTTNPLVYLTALGFAIGLNKELYANFLKHAKIIGVLSLVSSLLFYISFLSDYPGAVLANSSVLTLYIQGFILLCICSFCEKNRKKWLYYCAICISMVMGLMFNSRSWCIQAFIWLGLYTYANKKTKGFIHLLKILGIILIVFTITFMAVKYFYPNLAERFIAKLEQDTRSSQYADLFSQTTVWDYIIGAGYSFTYDSTIAGENYSYIDNGYLLTLVRYGLLIGITYPLMFIVPLFKRGFHRENIPILMWLMAMGGLSIYCGVVIDIKCIAIAACAGYCLSQATTPCRRLSSDPACNSKASQINEK